MLKPSFSFELFSANSSSFYYHTLGHLPCMKLVHQSQGQKKPQRQTDFSNLYTPQGPADVEKAEKWAIKVRFGIDTDLGLPSSIVLPSAQTWTLPLKFGFSINMSSWGENSVICLISLLPLLWHINIKNICEQIKDLPKHFSFYFT